MSVSESILSYILRVAPKTVLQF